ncbi:MAG TPA: D-2-hydroxyacid dehydrogenase [Tepidisphaeraceae bacterium]|jgi:phosphoglycerate dehydrogenase-like enzyme
MDPLNIWINQPFPDNIKTLLTESAAPHRLTFSARPIASLVSAGQPDPAAHAADVLYGQPDPADVLASPNLQWVQLTSAGYTRYDDLAFLKTLRERGVAFCNASGVFDEPCAQHVMAFLLSLARSLPLATAVQPTGQWNQVAIRQASFLLRRQKTLIVGYGAIARRLIEMLAPYNLHLVAFRRTVRGDEGVRTLPIEELDAHLPTAQIVINLLPASPSTRGLFGSAQFAKLPRDAIYINIGRGDTTDQPALLDALTGGRLAHAYLDVTTPEPLPPDHPLWRAPNCHITPHTAGGTVDELMRLAEHFLENLRRFTRGDAMLDRIV